MQHWGAATMAREHHEPPIRGTQEIRISQVAVPASEAPGQHRVLGRRVDAEGVVDGTHQPSRCLPVPQVDIRHAHTVRTTHADGHVATCGQAGQNDVAAMRQAALVLPSPTPSHRTSSCAMASASRSMTLSAIAVSSGVCDTKNSRS